ncbi:hypothetical protein CAPTEDRAFT_196728 [Capitella teleta]|uniref:CCHC-type domain-containing protein n=1 Tax=Capitella teleta TaxID=283909 RepID=R7U9A0_CAPTE|nr:hypothetical protein CAPTEDRAFT_196728 [Capitella teleta]|eukprot:ELU02549.1 hypothetical protein CAPTEDRAFT_196728 [Capitella teleta]
MYDSMTRMREELNRHDDVLYKHDRLISGSFDRNEAHQDYCKRNDDSGRIRTQNPIDADTEEMKDSTGEESDAKIPTMAEVAAMAYENKGFKELKKQQEKPNGRGLAAASLEIVLSARNRGREKYQQCVRPARLLDLVNVNAIMVRNKKRKTDNHGQTEATTMKTAVEKVFQGRACTRYVQKAKQSNSTDIRMAPNYDNKFMFTAKEEHDEKSKTNGQEKSPRKPRTGQLSLGRSKTNGQGIHSGSDAKEQARTGRQRGVTSGREVSCLEQGLPGAIQKSVTFNSSYFLNSQLLGSVNYCDRELELVPLDLRFDVYGLKARDSLLREGLRWIDGHGPGAEWGAFKQHLIQAFISQDADGVLRKELYKISKQPNESVVSFKRRFRDLVAEAYPIQYADNGVAIPRNADQVENLLKTYAKGLADKHLVHKMITPDWPEHLEQAMTRTALTEKVQDNLERLGFTNGEEPMEIAAFSQHKGEHVFKSTPEESQVKHLKSQYGKLERIIDQLTERIKDMGTNNTPSQSTYHDSRTCYYCGKTGHIKRDCRKRKRDQESASHQTQAHQERERNQANKHVAANTQ